MRFRPKPGFWTRFSALALLVATGGCNYGLTGGGFPEHIESLFIESFENETPQFDLEQRIFRAMSDEVPSALGVRIASRANADAWLTGSILGYDDVAQNYSSTGNNRVQVLQHQVRISVNVRLLDARQNVILWEGRVSGTGQYSPGSETEDVGRRLAIEHIVREVIDGAQSQW